MKYMSKHFTTDGCDQLILEPDDWTKEQYDAFLRIFGLKEAERIVITEYKLEAYGSEITEEDWTATFNHLNWIISEYAAAGWAGQFGLQGVLLPLKKRYDAGERTKKLYDEIMGGGCE